MKFIHRAIGAAKLAAKAHGPTIMVATGVVSMGASVVFASKKTLHLDEVLGEHVTTLEAIQDTHENPQFPSYGKKEAFKDRSSVYRHATVDLTKLYAVPGILFVGGACLVFGGHRIMLQRNATLALAFTALNEAYERYRANVRDTWGNDADQAMLTGYKITEVFDDESGKTKMVNTRDWDQAGNDPYNRVFSRETSSQWIDDLSVNKIFIQNQMRMAQIRLGLQGYLYLSDVYESLGFPETDISRVVGWKETLNPDGTKDIPVIDFGLDTPMPDDWKYSREKAIYLDFNCQGLIVGGRVQKALEKA